MKISIVVPSYNEKENVGLLIASIEENLTDYQREIIIVDDDSPDGTWKIVDDISKTNKNVKLIHRTNERGLTSAFNKGLELVTGDIVGWLDCDLTLPPDKLPFMLDEIKKGFDVVGCSRYIKDGADKRSDLRAVIGSWIINKMGQLLLDSSVTDYTTGYILCRREVIDNIKFRGDYGEYCIDFLYRAIKYGYKIKEIPLVLYDRKYGETKTASNFINYIKRGKKYLGILLGNRFFRKYLDKKFNNK